MLYHALRDRDSRAYFEQLEFRLDGALNDDAYARAWQQLVERHAILRTVFAVRNLPQPAQLVLRSAPLVIAQEDLRGQDGATARARIDRYKADDLARGFDLTAEVPMRLAVFRLGEETRRVVWSFHHILLDGWSLAILEAELDACYAAALAHRRPALPPAPPYGAYIRWLGRRDRAGAMAFWLEQLSGFAQPTPVPRKLAARFAAAAGPYEPGEVNLPLPAEAWAALQALARGQGVTVNAVVQTLWGLLLGRLNGRADAVFAATVAGRPAELPEAERSVGLFINAVAVRVRFDDGVRLGELLRRMQAQAAAGAEFHFLPLADLQAAHPLRQELTDHILVFENYPLGAGEGAALPRAAADDVGLHEHTHYPFEFQFLPSPDGASLRFRYDRGLFDDAAMAGLATGFTQMLPDARPERPAAELAFAGRARPAPGRLAVAASFTAEPVAEAAAFWLRQFACPTRVELAPYNQCLQQLADPASALNTAELGVLLLRFADALRDLGDDAGQAAARLQARYEELAAALAARPAGNRLVAALLPAPPAASPAAAQAARLEAAWRDLLGRTPGVSVLDLSDLAARHGIAQPFDAEADRLGHLPFAEAACAALGAELARQAVTLARAPFKVIAVDCDNTLWAGLCAEAGPLGVRIEAGHRALQKFLLDRQGEGFLLALASKNVAADVWAVFDHHPDMLLKREHIAADAVNWQAKPDNLRQLAKSLELGLDSIIFIDDSPAECAQVMERCPEVLTLPLPAESADYGRWLHSLWAFDQAGVTDEDRRRTAMIRAEIQRREALAAPGDAPTDPQAFAARLGLVVRVGPAQPHQFARIAQLTQRTNQFNLSGRRHDEAAVAGLAAGPDSAVLAVEVEDRFGAYGLTGVVICRRQALALVLDGLMLSCRVLGRRVEHALLTALAREARRHGLTELAAPLVPTERNQPVRDFLADPPWRQDGHSYRCPVADIPDALPGVELRCDYVFVAETGAFVGRHHPSPTPSPSRGGEKKALPLDGGGLGGGDAATTPHPIPFPMPLCNEAALRHGAQYLPLFAAAAGWPMRPLHALSAIGGRRAGRAPRAGTEAAVAAIWAEVLGLAEIDPARAFHELGGHSLHAVRVVSRLERAFGREIGLSRFLEAATVEALAAWLDARPATAPPPAAAPIAPAPPAADYPLSYNQQRLWLLCRMSGEAGASAAYNLCAAYRLRGPLDAAALAQAGGALLRRHPALATVFVQGEDGPRQRIAAAAGPVLSLHEAAGQPLETLADRIAEDARTPVDLETGPLFRLELYRRGAEEHVLAIHLHHLVGDGWSFGLLLEDLGRLYAGAETKAPPALRYVDFAAWNRSAEGEAALARHGAYWRQRLGGIPPIAAVPPDFRRPPAPSGRGAGLCGTLAEGAALDTWLAGRGAGLFAFLAALVAALVYRHGEEAAVRLGTPAAGRDRPELEEVVGLFANTLVLDFELADDQPFTALLAAAEERSRAAVEHQSYPFDRLVADLRPEREAGRNPLFDVLVALQDAPRTGAGLAGVAVEDMALETGLAAFDLVFEFARSEDGGLVCALRYSSDLYGPATARRLMGRLQRLTAAVLAHPEAAIADLPLLGAAEAAELAAFAEGPRRPLPETTIPALFAERAAAWPTAPALLFAGAEGAVAGMDYRTLDRRANALAHRLAARVAAGGVTAVLLERGPAWAVALLAAMKAGTVYLPLDPRHPPARLAELLADAGAQALIATPELAALTGATSADATLACLDPAGTEEAPAPPERPRTPDDAAYLIYTSGSTGKPKGVLVQHRAFLNMILDQIRGFAVGGEDRVLQLASPAFDASLSELFMGLLAGAAVALADAEAARDGERLGRFLKASAATVATFVPSHLRQLEDDDLASLRRVILAGEAVLPDDAARLQRLGHTVYNAYGPTETAVCATLQELPPGAGSAPIGRPLANLSALIQDRRGHPAPVGVAGELIVAGAGVALGYLNRPELSAERFLRLADGRPAYRTGDRARWRSDGTIDYLGRGDDQVKIRGHRIEPGEVAAHLRALAGVRQAAVTVEDGAAGPELVAYLCGGPDDDARLRAELGALLPAHMIPARFVRLAALPLTTSGKLDRRALPRPAPVPARATASQAMTATERVIFDIWRELLPGLADPRSDFFAAGGNSLLAMAAARRIGRALGRPCPALRIFQAPTVAGLARSLADEPPGEEESMLHRLGPAAGRPLVALPPAPGLGLVFAPLAARLPGWSLQAFDFRDLAVPSLIGLYLDRLDAAPAEGGAPALLGYSGGGRLALGLAAAMAERGRPPSRVILMDCWRWSGAGPEDAAGDDALERAYRRRLGAWLPRTPLAVPVDHLLAAVDLTEVPPDYSRDWRHLAPAGYREHALADGHHDLLRPHCLAATAQALLAVLDPQPIAVPGE